MLLKIKKFIGYITIRFPLTILALLLAMVLSLVTSAKWFIVTLIDLALTHAILSAKHIEGLDETSIQALEQLRKEGTRMMKQL